MILLREMDVQFSGKAIVKAIVAFRRSDPKIYDNSIAIRKKEIVQHFHRYLIN